MLINNSKGLGQMMGQLATVFIEVPHMLLSHTVSLFNISEIYILAFPGANTVYHRWLRSSHQYFGLFYTL